MTSEKIVSSSRHDDESEAEEESGSLPSGPTDDQGSLTSPEERDETCDDRRALVLPSIREDLVGTYSSRSQDGKTAMLLSMSEDGRWEHYARRCDTTQHYIFRHTKKSGSVVSWLLSWLPLSITCDDSISDKSKNATPRSWDGKPRDVTVRFWEVAQCTGNWELNCTSVPPTVRLRCDPLGEGTWTSGQSDPSLPLRKMYQAALEDREHAAELAQHKELEVAYSVMYGEDTDLIYLQLKNNYLGSSLKVRQEVPSSIDESSKTRIIVQTLGFHHLYQQMP